MHKNFPKYFLFIDKLNIENIKEKKKKTAVIYRNYEKKPEIDEVKKFKNFCKKKKSNF